jgi:alkanesulfonate monooxygenase SsuD/methylene tetrahydromethanopterin reductase-like flavin-dependent oxidoreductase (luciferase family)
MDYKHELEFGLFLNPDAHDPQEVLRVARLADSLGLDFVAVQDHPYQQAHLESVALLSTIAATTKQITVQPHVISLPLRLPALLAKEFATIDILSGGGRTELGLGAGAFWQAIQAFGGPVRTAREAVQALEEAIAIIRGMWTPALSVKVPGEYYAVRHVRPGPFPIKPIPIGIGAVGPKMLALIGRVADDWLVSGYADLEQLAEGNRRIDEAATAAGRSPEAIRRTYGLNVSGLGKAPGPEMLNAQEWIERGTRLALEYGVGRFWVVPVGGSWDRTLHFIAEEVAPGVRKEVASGRAGDEVGVGL